MKLVKMICDNGREADVHPNEVENYKAGGYRVIDDGAKAAASPVWSEGGGNADTSSRPARKRGDSPRNGGRK